LKVVGADHTNFRVKDLAASLGFYRDVLGLQPFGLEEYHRGERPIVSLRVTEDFILHLTPKPEFERGSTGGYDHLALVVEDAEPDELAEYGRAGGVSTEVRRGGREAVREYQRSSWRRTSPVRQRPRRLPHRAQVLLE
jgi:catechol 2,3-dioxygenase-like lactoylglutathione lyase family enzyme